MPKLPPLPPFEHTFPTPEQMEAAQRACCGRVCQLCESPAAYAWRMREIDLAALLDEAIVLELTQTEQQAINAYWFMRRTITQIAQHNGVSPAAVHKTLARAQAKLYRVLRYVVWYQNNQMEATLVPAAVQKAALLAAAKAASPPTLALRLSAARQKNNLSLQLAAQRTGIPPQRLSSLEAGEASPDIRELLALSVCYETTTDYLLCAKA